MLAVKEKVKSFPEWMLKDLAKSGIPEDVARNEYNFCHVLPDTYKGFLGFSPSREIDAYCIPYIYPESGIPMTCSDGRPFIRVKFREPVKMSEDKKSAKYVSPANGGIHVFIPPKAHEVFIQNPDVTVYITEGEKKAIKATLEGFPCIGLCGIWGWLESKKFRLDQYAINRDLVQYITRRNVVFIFDSDAQETAEKKKGFDNCAKKFAESLKFYSSRLYRVDLPELQNTGGKDE